MIAEQDLIRALMTPARIKTRPFKVGRPEKRPNELPGTGRIGAVMLLLYVCEQTHSQQVILTKRHHNLKHHPGQISLPGGQQDHGERLRDTALRETREEIGVTSDRIRIAGELNTVYIPPSDYTVSPFVGWCDSPVEFVLSEAEVEELLFVDLTALLAPNAFNLGWIETDSAPVESVVFDLRDDQIWGATAIILNDFALLIRASLSAGSDHPDKLSE